MKQDDLRVCVTTIPMGEPRDTASRIEGAKLVLDEARHFDAHLVVLPATMVIVPWEHQVRARSRPLINAARARDIGIVFGVRYAKQGWLVAWTPGMRGPLFWSDDAPAPQLLRFGRHSVAVLSEDQAEDRELRRAAVDAHPELVIVCTGIALGWRYRTLERFRRLGVPVAPSASTMKPETAPLVCPRGYRLPDMSVMKGGIMVSMFDIDEEDGALDAA